MRVATVMLADLEGDIQTISTKISISPKTALLYHNPQDYYITFAIESEKAFKLSLVLRTWHLVVRPEGRFHSQCQKGGQKNVLNIINSFNF